MSSSTTPLPLMSGETLTITAVTQGAQGTVAIVGGTSVTYTPSANYFGPDSFTYTISDGNGGSATGTVNVTVNNVNDPPVASFSATPTSGIGPLGVAFTDTSTDIDNSIAAWNWDFGDGTAPSTLQNPSHTYNLAGTFTVTLTVTDASGGTNSTTTTITVTASMSINSLSVAESVGTANFTVSLSVPGANDVTVNYATANGSAVAGQDYTARQRRADHSAGSASGTIPVTIIDDALVEYDETFTLTLSGPSANATITGGATATGTILIDDLYQITIADVTVGEGDGTATFDVSVSPAIQVGDSVTLSYVTVAGSATAGADYVTATGSLTFAPGDTTQNIVVTILNDAILEPIETFSVNLFTPTPAAITSIVDFAAECFIVENDRTLTIDKSRIRHRIRRCKRGSPFHTARWNDQQCGLSPDFHLRTGRCGDSHRHA